VNITFVSEHASPLAALGGVDAGGQNVHVAELAKALVGRGHRVSVVTRRDDPDLPTELVTEHGYRVVHVTAGPVRNVPKDDLWPHMTTFSDGLLAVLADERPDLVHAHFWMSGWAAQRAAAVAGLPTVITFHALGSVKRRHQGSADTSPAQRVAVETDLATSVQRIIATCTDEVAELSDLTSHPAVTSVVPCGVDVRHFTPTGDVRDDRCCPRRIVALGRLVPRKGFATVIEALPKLPDTELVLAGGSGGPEPERDRLLEIAAAHGVEQRVRMLPQVGRTEVPALLRSADVVVATPWYEPFGIVPLEAMACGRPVVATAVGGMLDSVVPGQTGTLVPPHDPAALAAALQHLLDRPALRERLGRHGVERARTHYAWTSVAERTLRAYALTLTRHLREGGSRGRMRGEPAVPTGLAEVVSR
jgi:D-inositol-3-phosphate glycosyltransferase